MNRIKQLRNEKKIKQVDLCKQLGIVQGTLSMWENNKYEPDQNSLIKMSEIFGVSIDYILGNSNIRTIASESKAHRIKVYGSVPAGIPVEAVQDIINWEEIPSDWIKNGAEYIALKVKGNSMAPKYMDGDIVIIKIQPDCESGQDAIVFINGYDATLKRVIKNKDSVILQPLNPEYPPKSYSENEEIITILGIVVELRRKI